MTVQELIDQLSTMPRDMQVWMSKDGEGNAFRNVDSVDIEKMICTNEEWNADVLHPDDYKEFPDAMNCVVIKPTY